MNTMLGAPAKADVPVPPRPRWLDARLYPFASRYVEIDGHRIHYIDEGSGPTLLFLHAVPLWSFQYRKMITGLRDRFRCVALDYPGFGLSAAAPGYHATLAGTSELVEQFIAARHLSDLMLVGHDSSAAAGLGVVARHPQWFTGLVISNSFAWPLDETPSIYRFVKIVSSPGFRFMIVNFNFLINYTVKQLADGKLSTAERRAYRGPFLSRGGRYHQHDMFKTLTRSGPYLIDLQARIRGLREMPALLIFSDNDSTYKAGFLSRYERLFPRRRTVIIKGTGNAQADHFPQEFAPGQMVSAIRDWWKDDVGTRP